MDTSSNLDNNIIKEGSHVIIRKLHDKTFGRLVKLDSNSTFLIGKIKFSIMSLVGKEFGSICTVNNKTKCLEYVEKFDELFDLKSAFDELKDDELDRDNRSIVDDNRSQKLTTTEINSFKADGLTTKKIIENIVENSSTFNLKTVFSQEKYLKKKQEKYSNYLRIYKPNATLLCDMWYNQGASKTANIRIDSLAQILNLCNVRSGCKYIIVDNYFGLVSAAVLERLIGDGKVFDKLKNGEIDDVGKCVQIITDEGPVYSWRQAIDALNFKEEHLKHCLLMSQIHKTMPIIHGQSITNKTPSIIHDQSIKNMENETLLNQIEESNVETKGEQNEIENDDRFQDSWEHHLSEKRKDKNDEDNLENEFRINKRCKIGEKYLRRQKRLAEESVALELMAKKNFDGLIVILRNHNAPELVDYLINFLMPSAQFVVFSEFKEPLIECYNHLRNKTCNIKLSESWMRQFQILPMRTRPEIEMFGKSGFILHGVKLLSD